MGRIEELKKLADICRNERTVSVGDFFTMDDIDYLISCLQIAEEALKLAVTKMDKMERQIESEWGDNVYADSENFKYSEEYYRVLHALEQIQKEE